MRQARRLPFARLARSVAAYLFAPLIGLLGVVLVLCIGPRRMWVVLLRVWARGTLFIVGVRLRIRGSEHLAGPGLFISNHESLIDIVILPAIVPRTTHIVAKRQLLYVPLLGWAFAASGAVLVDRRRPRLAVASLRRGCQNLPRGWSLAIFPEGTRSHTGEVAPFKKGAFHLAKMTGLPLIPIGLDGARLASRPHTWQIDGGEVRVCVGAPIDASAWRPDDIAMHTAALQQAVRGCVAGARAMRERESP